MLFLMYCLSSSRACKFLVERHWFCILSTKDDACEWCSLNVLNKPWPEKEEGGADRLAAETSP